MSGAPCPFLGLPDDERTRLAYPSPAQRCFAQRRRPAPIGTAYQSSSCLTDAHTGCPRFVAADHRPMVQRGGMIPPLPVLPSPPVPTSPTPPAMTVAARPTSPAAPPAAGKARRRTRRDSRRSRVVTAIAALLVFVLGAGMYLVAGTDRPLTALDRPTEGAPTSVSFAITLVPSATPVLTRSPNSPTPDPSTGPPVATFRSPSPAPATTFAATPSTTARQLRTPGSTASPDPSGSVRYVVRRGDTLSLIAARFGVSVAAIVDLNGIEDPSLILTGQVLIIPVPQPSPS